MVVEMKMNEHARISADTVFTTGSPAMTWFTRLLHVDITAVPAGRLQFKSCEIQKKKDDPRRRTFPRANINSGDGRGRAQATLDGPTALEVVLRSNTRQNKLLAAKFGILVPEDRLLCQPKELVSPYSSSPTAQCTWYASHEREVIVHQGASGLSSFTRDPRRQLRQQ